LVGAFIAFFSGKNFILEAWSAYTLPLELKEALFVASEGEKSIAYTPEKFRYTQVPYSTGMSSSVIREGNRMLAVRQEGQEYLLEENGTELIRGTLPIAAPSFETNSERIIYAQAVAPEVEVKDKSLPHISAVNPSQYEVRLYFPPTGKSERIISGYAPLFLDEAHFLFFVTSGIYRYNLTSGTIEKVLDKTLSSVFVPVLQSPDRTLILVRDGRERTTSVFRVTPAGLAIITQIPGLLTSPALSNDALYEIKGNQVWKYSFDTPEPQLIHTFPSTLSISRIVF
jgi:hypothetical protein